MNSVGSIEFIDDLQVNAAKIETRGLDVVASYSQPVDLFGSASRINARIAYTHLFQYDFTPLPGEDPDVQDGEIGTAADRFTASLGLKTDIWSINFTGTYIGKSYEDDQSFCAFFNEGAPRCVSAPAKFYLDMQSSFYASDALEVYFGVDNLLDTKAPKLLTNTTFNTTGSDTAADVYDVFGRRFYTGVRMRF